MSNWTKTVERYILEGRTVSGGCGADSDQKQISQQQQQNFQTLNNQAGQVFGAGSQVFKDLTSSFEPVLAAGEDQSGFSAAQLANLKSQAITNTGVATRNAQQAAGERGSAQGGGTTILPNGAQMGQNAAIAEAGSNQTAGELSNINLQNAELGRQNWMNAAGVLSGAPGVFNAATGAAGASTTAGSDAFNSATGVNNANNAWVGDVAGVLGDAAGIGAKFINPLAGGGGGGGGAVPGSGYQGNSIG